MTILIFLLISYILLCYGLSLLFKKAGINAINAWIPGLNFAEWARIIGRNPYYVFWYFFPIVNLFIFVGMAMDLIKSFGKFDTKSAILNFIYIPGYLTYLGHQKDANYIGPYVKLKKEYEAKLEAARESGNAYEIKKLEKNNPYTRSTGREWLESIVFAVFAAAFIRMFLIEAYTIPTSSMEGSLLVGDYLFVSKVHYGLRLPMTVLQFPLLHNVMPITGSESYLEKPSLPYKRLPKLTSVKRNDPMVFNWPVGDSVYLTPSRSFDVGQIRNNPELKNVIRGSKLVTRPMDKTDFYIKRTIGVPGDSLQIIDRQVYIDGKAIENPHNLQYVYNVTSTDIINTNKLREVGVSPEDIIQKQGNNYTMILNQDQIDFIKSNYPSSKFMPYKMNEQKGSRKLFPNDPKITDSWTVDNYGPIYIPKAGDKIKLTSDNIKFYHRVITTYEGNTLEKRGEDYYINGTKADEYTLKYNYYWMMGDNRHNSEDSRVWGYVPETHVVGKPLFIFFSTDEGSIFNGIRWNRLFTGARKFE